VLVCVCILFAAPAFIYYLILFFTQLVASGGRSEKQRKSRRRRSEEERGLVSTAKLFFFLSEIRHTQALFGGRFVSSLNPCVFVVDCLNVLFTFTFTFITINRWLDTSYKGKTYLQKDAKVFVTHLVTFLFVTSLFLAKFACI